MPTVTNPVVLLWSEPSRQRRSGLITRMPVFVLALAACGTASANQRACSNATLKGTYLLSESGVLNGKPYAESGREV
jgi:hypothetical protein